MTSQVIERDSWAEVRHDEYLPNGGVYWVKIELTETPAGVVFRSPIDGYEHLVEGLTLKELDTEWWLGDFDSEILDAIANSGDSRWVMGEQTQYDYIEEDGKHYLEVTEIMRGDTDEFLKTMKEEV